MKKLLRSLSCLLCCLLLGCVLLPGAAAEEIPTPYEYPLLDMTSETVKQEVTVKTFVDGDTTHFHVPESVHPSGVLKARYLAVDTPESTGKIEEYGKAASLFTREKLESAVSIVIESDDGQWNRDTTGDRYLVWVWYKPDEISEYRCLNIELLEQGLAHANSSARNRYGNDCMQAILRGKTNKLNLHSGQKDPGFYYGEAVELTLRELRCNLDKYNGVKVAFSGVITLHSGSSVYIESFDAETNRWYGMSVYYGFGLNGKGLSILSVGNEARIVGTLQYYEAGDSWQVSGLSYRMMKPDDPGNIQKLSEGHAPAWALISPAEFVSTVEAETESGMQTFDRAALAMATTVDMQGLTVTDVLVTEEGDDAGALTLLCEADGVAIQVRTLPMQDAGGALIGPEAYLGKTIDVKGVVDRFDGAYQIKVFRQEHLTLHP